MSVSVSGSVCATDMLLSPQWITGFLYCVELMEMLKQLQLTLLSLIKETIHVKIFTYITEGEEFIISVFIEIMFFF